MIVKGNSYSSASFWSMHLMRRDTNEEVRVVEMRGLTADTVRDALYEMRAIGQGAGVEKAFYIVSLNTKADEPLTPEQWSWAADRVERELGFEGQARFIVEHTKAGADGVARTHQHIAWLRIDVDTMRGISDSHNYRKHEIAARAIEQEFDLTPVESTLTRDKATVERVGRRPGSDETFRAMDSGIDPEAVKREITALWHASDNCQAFRAALEDAGYILARGDRRDFCIVDPAGDEHSLGKRLVGARAADVRAYMAEVDRGSLPALPRRGNSRAPDRRKAERRGLCGRKARRPWASSFPMSRRRSATNHRSSRRPLASWSRSRCPFPWTSSRPRHPRRRFLQARKRSRPLTPGSAKPDARRPGAPHGAHSPTARAALPVRSATCGTMRRAARRAKGAALRRARSMRAWRFGGACAPGGRTHWRKASRTPPSLRPTQPGKRAAAGATAAAHMGGTPASAGSRDIPQPAGSLARLDGRFRQRRRGGYPPETDGGDTPEEPDEPGPEPNEGPDIG